MLYNSLKKFVNKIPIVSKIFVSFKDYLLDLYRLKDVLMMMLTLHIWPEQTFRFSTRKFLPSKKNKYSINSKPKFPYELLDSKSSIIPKMKEITVIGIGSSFDLKQLNEISGPIFLVSFWGTLKIDENGEIVYSKEAAYGPYKWKHYTDSHKGRMEEDFEDLRDLENENLTYVTGDGLEVQPGTHGIGINLLKKKGHNVIVINTYSRDKEGNHFPTNNLYETPSYQQVFDGKQCKRISLAENILKPPILPPHPHWTHTGSFLTSLCALSFFADKINVYGWDCYLNSSPEKMSYTQTFFSMYNFKLDKIRGRGNFEEAIFNFYYGSELSKNPKFKIHGYVGKLGKHKKLIDKIERVLFN